MLLRRRSVLTGGLAFAAGLGRSFALASPEEDLAELLKAAVDVGRHSTGLVAIVLDGDKRIDAAYGRSDSTDNRALDADTVFEIGSITKAFTALLLADMIARGEVAASDPVAKYLPGDVRVPYYEETPITLKDLATYTSGLPRMPANFTPKNLANPYVDYSVAQLYDFVSNHKLGFRPGTHYEYANLGFGLLGHALALRAGMSYEDLVVSRICAPLGMESTRITLSPSMQARLARGHDATLEPVPNWDIPTLAGAGALRSTANDLLKFLEMCLGNRPSPLAPAMAMTLGERFPTGRKRIDVALGWFVSTSYRDEIIWKDGGTGGYASFIGYSTKSRRAGILLSNTADYGPNLRLGVHLVNSAYSLSPPTRPHIQIAVDAAILAPYAGRYEISPTFALTVRVDGNRLFVQATGQAEYEAFAESETDFFYRVVDAQITFDRADTGVAQSLTVHQNGKDLPGRRVP
jgi:D-alanyl-D-alanine-carboxypeptidase/D-alanyl-D-alanine-endopeptidase